MSEFPTWLDKQIGHKVEVITKPGDLFVGVVVQIDRDNKTFMLEEDRGWRMWLGFDFASIGPQRSGWIRADDRRLPRGSKL